MKADKEKIAPPQSIAEEPVEALGADKTEPLTFTQTTRHPETGELTTGLEKGE